MQALRAFQKFNQESKQLHVRFNWSSILFMKGAPEIAQIKAVRAGLGHDQLLSHLGEQQQERSLKTPCTLCLE